MTRRDTGRAGLTLVRAAAPTDRAAIRAVHLAAFPGADEADLVEALSRDGDLAISLVAVEDGAIVGHIAFSVMRVVADGASITALGLAPLAVRPAHQRTGAGSALIEAGIVAAREAGAQMIFVLGNPDYYGRFGFDAAEAAAFASPYAGPHLMALRLSGESYESGAADYAPAFSALG